MTRTAEVRKPFGLWSATFLVVANMIGAGVFTTSGFAFADLGSRQHVLLAWLIGACIACCGAISYGQLAQRVAESGGEYLFLSRFAHPLVGFLAGWVSLLAGFTGAIAFAASAFESYAIPATIRPAWLPPGVAGIAAIVGFAALHSVVLRAGMITQNVVVVLKLALLIGFIGYAWAAYPSGWPGLQITTQPTEFSIYSTASTLVWISLSFSGFNAAVYITGEVDRPETNVPRAMLLGTICVSILYLVLNFVFLYGATPKVIRAVPDIAAVASQAIGGRSLATLMRIIVSVALLSSVSSMLVAGPRVYAMMAKDGVFPKLFAPLRHHDLETPTNAIWLQAAFASVVVYSTSLKSLLDYLGFTLSVTAALAVACIFWTRRSADNGTSRLLFSFIAALYVSATIVLAVLSVYSRPQQLIGFVVTVVSGLALYLCFARAVPKTD